MKCSICGYDEKVLLLKKEKMLKYVEDKLDVLISNYDNKLNDFKEKIGFSDRIKSEILEISEEIRKVSKSAFLENTSIFEKMEPKLNYLINYSTGNFNSSENMQLLANSRKVKNSISWNTIGDLIQSFLKEPTPNRIPLEISDIKRSIDEFTAYKVKLKSICTFFLEKEFETTKLTAFKGLDKLIKQYDSDCSETLFPIYSIIICPFCASLFDEASKAAYKVIEAKTRVDDDWGDDEDEY